MRALKPRATGLQRKLQNWILRKNATHSSGSKPYPNSTPMSRGDVVIVSAPGDYGKPRPAVIVQSNAIPESCASVVICPMTSELVEAEFRITIEPGADTGLRIRSQVMADKPVTVRRERIGQRIGRLRGADIARLNVALAFVMGLAD